ncbi:MAG: signal recognition particle protein [Candidatus Diapherotrites archaeon]|nr:signal recognition particle protein [Candidatus Diapherotrites archaeon]
MVVSKLASGLRGVISKISGAAVVDEALLKSSIKELQRTLISADVNIKLVFELSKRIESRVKDATVPAGISQKEHFIKLVYDELISLVGEEFQPEVKPQKILLVGTYGHGKTTTTAKLAKYFAKRGLKPAIITTDTWRPAAYEQVEQLAERVKVPMFGIKGEKDAAKILKQGIAAVKGHDLLIVDSAGRDSLNKELIDEVKDLSAILKPDQKILVLGADMGQTAGKQAKEFNDAIGLTGVIVTRMDSSAKGGGALSACAEAGIPITFIGTGEKPEDLEAYDPQKYISRLLGYPDLGSLMERIKEVVEEEDLSPEDLMKGEFTLKKFYKQLEATKKMGSLSKVFEQLGMSAQLPDDVLEQSEEKMKSYKHIMDSMTEKELEDPDVINSSRIRRIAKGSGKPESAVRELLKQFNATKKIFKKFKKGKRLPKGLSKMMGKLGMGM